MLYVVPSREQGEKKIKPEIFAVPYTRYSVAAMDTKVLRSASITATDGAEPYPLS